MMMTIRQLMRRATWANLDFKSGTTTYSLMLRKKKPTCKVKSTT